ncbi:DUF4384 domain-containing protein [Thermodesulfobacteriota bacterium]
MESLRLRSVASTLSVIGSIVLALILSPAGNGHAAEKNRALLQVGNPGPKAVGLKVWTADSSGQAAAPGDTIPLHMKASAKAYVTALYVSTGGNVLVLFPNKENSDNLVQPGKDYTLFGKGSAIKLTVSPDKPEPKIVFYVSEKPLPLDGLEIPAGQACINISAKDTGKLGALKRELEKASKQPTFNRVIATLKTADKDGMNFRFMGLPEPVTSDKPSSITGVHGLKPGAKPDLKK